MHQRRVDPEVLGDGVEEREVAPVLHALDGAQAEDAHAVVERLAGRRVQRQTREHNFSLGAKDLEVVIGRRECVRQLEAGSFVSTDCLRV
jgi:hypothetical protein